MNAQEIETTAKQEIANERFREAVESAKRRLRERRWWHRIFPFKIAITRR
jgi:hypothetical protein